MGLEVHYCHQSTLFHLESVSEGRHDRAALNLRLLHERWKNRLVSDEWQYYIADGLVEITYNLACPHAISISPLLGTISQEGRQTESDRLLAVRSRQVRELLRENTGFLIEKAIALST
jgi:hypothetical protein